MHEFDVEDVVLCGVRRMLNEIILLLKAFQRACVLLWRTRWHCWLSSIDRSISVALYLYQYQE